MKKLFTLFLVLFTSLIYGQSQFDTYTTKPEQSSIKHTDDFKGYNVCPDTPKSKKSDNTHQDIFKSPTPINSIPINKTKPVITATKVQHIKSPVLNKINTFLIHNL